MSSLLIQGARLLDPSLGLDATGDLWMRDGTFVAPLTGRPDHTIDGRGLIAMPGLVDLHVHLREPGDEEAETIETGCRAALAGGFTAIACMPNTRPPLDRPEIVRRVIERAEDLRLCRVSVVACLTRGRSGRDLADLEALAAAGAVAFSDDGSTPSDPRLVLQALGAAARLGVPVADHCEEPGMVEGGVLNEGAVARRLHVPPRWPSAEELVVARDVMLAEVTGAAVHIQHLSTAHAVEFVASARKRGARVTAEATPHHLTLTEEDAACGDPVFKMNPPLRTDGDMQALRRALADGTITCVATDHAPHTAAAKARGLRDAPAGVIGMETALAVVWTRLVEPGLLTPLQAADRMSLGPARAFGLPGGSIAPGSPADVVLFDPREAWTVDPARFLSRSRNCPFAGQLLRGRVAATIVAGEVRHRSA